MSSFQVTQELILDAAQLGEQLEAQFGMYLLPPAAGLYMPHQSKPTMRASFYYYQLQAAESSSSARVAVMSLSDIHGDVFDADDNLVVSKKTHTFLRSEPTLPVSGMQLVSDVVNWVIQNASEWTCKKCPPLSSAIEPHLKEEYRQRMSDEQLELPYMQQRLKQDPQLQQRLQTNRTLMDMLEDMTAPLRYNVRDFIGRDTWVLHFHKLKHRDIIVEKTVDYRIYMWELEHGHEYRG